MSRTAPQTTPPPEIDLKAYVEIIGHRRRLFLQVLVLVFAVCLLITFLSKPVYQTEAKLLVQTGNSSVSLVDASNPIATMLQAAQPDAVGTQLQVLQSTPFLAEARQAAGVKPKQGVAPPVVRVETVDNTNVIRISAEGGDPNDVAKMANAVLDLHLRRTELLQSQGLEQTMQFVKAEKAKSARDLTEAESRLALFRKNHRIVQATVEQEAQTKEYVALQTKLREAQSNLEVARTKLAQTQARLDKEPVDRVSETSRENPRVAALRDKIEDLELQRADLLREFRPGSRQLQGVEEQLKLLRERYEAEPPRLIEHVQTPNERRIPLLTRLSDQEAAIDNLQAEISSASAGLQTQQKSFDDLGPWEVRLTALTRDRDIAQEAFTMLSNRLRDLEIRSNAHVSVARQIERAAVPAVPIRPNKVASVVFSLALALCFAIGFVFFQEYLDDRINSPEDVSRISALPTLGRVPPLAAGDPRLVSAIPGNSRVAECYRTLRSSIGFAGIGSPLRRLQVTSSSPGEGKSQTSANVAAAMAMDGKKVILIDADMRRPTLHHVLERQASPGLSDMLAGIRSLEEVLQETEVANLLFISAGTIPPNPAELLGSPAFDHLLDLLDARADVVVVDSPPCLPVADPLIIAARMSGVVLVVEVGQTRKADMKTAEDLLLQAHARIVGVVFNRFENRGGKRRAYNDYYYYANEPDSKVKGRKLPLPNGHREAVGMAVVKATRSTSEDSELL